MEVSHYKFFIGRFVKTDIDLVSGKLDKMISGMKDTVAKKELFKFVEEWKSEMSRTTSYPDSISEIIA